MEYVLTLLKQKFKTRNSRANPYTPLGLGGGKTLHYL